MLPPGGRLVTITSEHCVPSDAAWTDAFARHEPPARCVFTMAIDGRAYARRGTGFDTRLTVLERSSEPGIAADRAARAANAAELLDAVTAQMPKRRPIAPAPMPAGPARDLFGKTVAPKPAKRAARNTHPRPRRGRPTTGGRYPNSRSRPARSSRLPPATETPAGNAGPYASWRPGAVRVPARSRIRRRWSSPPPWRPCPIPRRPGARSCPRGSSPRACCPTPSWKASCWRARPIPGTWRRSTASAPGWETVHRCKHDDDGNESLPSRLGGRDRLPRSGEEVDTSFVTEDGETLSEPVRFRRGWMLGDGTGCGKGRQVAAIILDNRLRGRKRALWLSQSDKLLEDARRDWTALGGLESDVIPLGNFRQGMEIPLDAGILFATYATLRSPSRQGKPSRLDQIVEWLAGSLDEEDRHSFDGVIVFDEAHAMANAAGSRSERGEVKPSQQGRAGLRLQNALPDARIAYVSATGATTLPGLAYAGRLGLWAAGETPFETRVEFVSAMEAGGVAAMEVVARDLKALGLYQARALAYEGVEVDILEHPLTPEQRRIYDAYAGAFKIIHKNIEDALEATGIVQGEDTLNRNAKSAALSAFEGTKQRFFGHLLTGMKCPSLIRAVEADLEAGRSAVVQLVSTGEALMERRISEIPASEWDDLNIDLTPRDGILSFLMHAFPVQLQEPFTDDDGNLMSRPATDEDGNPVICREAEQQRDALIEKLAALPPVPTALDQVVQKLRA